ncbi:hypothetical protein GM182_00555 [bacterium 3DAC]|nr:hypothetical protein GM182_00555 [bacterium 3DAC]
MKKIFIAMVLILFAVILMVAIYMPQSGKVLPYTYVEFGKDLVMHDLSTGMTASITPPGYLMGIAPHALVFAKPINGEKQMQLIYLYGATASRTIGTYDMPTLVGVQGDNFSVVIYGKTVSDMKVCAIGIDGQKKCVPMPADAASDLQTLGPANIKVWYDGTYFYYLGRLVLRFGSGQPKQIEENADLMYAYVLPLNGHRFILGGKTVSLYDKDGFVKSATVKLSPRWISPRMVLCKDAFAVPAGSKGYKIAIPSMEVLKSLSGIPVGCIGDKVILFKGTYPIKGEIVSEDGHVYLKDVSFGALIGGIRP